MKTPFTLTLTALFFTSIIIAQPVEINRSLHQITVSGDGYQRGVQHGKQLSQEIADIVAKWKVNTSLGLNRDADEVLKEFLEYANFESAIKKWTPDLWDEVKGIAAGSGQNFKDILVLNLLDEFWVYVNDIQNHHCSGLGVPGKNGSPAYVAQNMDLETYTDGYQVLMRIEGSEDIPDQLLLTHAGLIVLNGINEHGIATCVNTIMQLKASSSGLPVAFVIRGILAQNDKKSVLHFVKNVHHASGQNYIVGIGDEVFDFEASANKVVRFHPKNKNGTVYHTNHPLVNDDIKPWFDDFHPDKLETPRVTNSNSAVRLEAVKVRMESDANLDASAIQMTLRSRDSDEHPVCRTHLKENGGFTFASVIYSLGKTPGLQLAIGPPDESKYMYFDFSKMDSGSRD